MSESPLYLTLSEVARRWRYEDESGALTKQALHACRRRLSSKGLRPQLGRGLYRLDAIEALEIRRDMEQGRRRKRGFKSHASRFQQGNRSLDSLGVSGELVGDRHADTVERDEHEAVVHSLDGVR